MTNKNHRRGLLSVVVPVYNEHDSWRDILARVQSTDLLGLEGEIILVDDCSTDGTRQQLEQFAAQQQIAAEASAFGGPKIKVIFHQHNLGKGAALRTGFAAAEGQFVIVQDADLEYDPRDYPKLISPILAGQADAVYGSRLAEGKPTGMRLMNYLANKLLTAFSNFATGLKLTDMETCYKLVRGDALQQISLEEDRFGFEPEITAKLARSGARILEVPISYNARRRQEGKKIGWKDGLRAIWCIIRYGFLLRRRRS